MGKNISTLWGDFEDSEPKEEIIDKTDTEGLTDEELEEKKSKDSKDDDPEDVDTKEESEEEKKVQEEKTQKEESKTSEEVDALTETFESVSDLLEKEDLMFLDEETQYTSDAKGFAKMMRDNMERQKQHLEEEFKKREADIRYSYENTDGGYSDLDPEDDKQAERMVLEYYKSTGIDEEDIKEKLEILKDTDTLSKEGKLAQKYLVKREEKQKQESLKEREDEDKERELQITEYINGLKSEIDSAEEMVGFELTNKLRKDFKDYLFKQDSDGQTPAQKAGRDPKRRLRLAFMDFMDYNKKDFEIKAKTEVSKELRKKTSRFTNENTSTKGKGITKDVSGGDESFKKGFLDFWGV